MTTAREPDPRPAQPGYRTTEVMSAVGGAAGWTFAAGLLVVAAAALLSGLPAALGAGIGMSMVCLFFATGAVVLAVVGRLAPSASLLVALLTYTLKVVLIGLVFVSLRSSGALAGAVDARWLAGTVVGCTLTWTTVQVVYTMRARQLAYDLPPAAEEASVR